MKQEDKIALVVLLAIIAIFINSVVFLSGKGLTILSVTSPQTFLTTSNIFSIGLSLIGIALGILGVYTSQRASRYAGKELKGKLRTSTLYSGSSVAIGFFSLMIIPLIGV